VVTVRTGISRGTEEEGLFTTFSGSWSGMNMSENQTFWGHLPWRLQTTYSLGQTFSRIQPIS